ncbi:MAG: hypothetical protein R3264_16740 [Anaerolineae bacterium]|nr:hypothetical protein [Anaerolineae bacterium]
MLIEVGSPATLPLGLVKFNDDGAEKICLLGLTVQHPPVQMFAEKRNKFQITGPRADLAHRFAAQFYKHHHLKPQVELEIESTIPNLVGLGSATMLGLSVHKALSWTQQFSEEQRQTEAFAQVLALEPWQTLDLWGFDRGGLLLIDLERLSPDGLPTISKRQEIQHKEKEAWAFVFYFPDRTETLPETLEAERWAALFKSSSHLSDETGELVTAKLWPAVEADDVETFGESLLALHQLNEEALAKAGTPLEIAPEDLAVLDVMRDTGAVAWGQNLTGFSFYGLIKGGQPSRVLRKNIRDKVGFFGGTVLATITDNRGSVEAIHNRAIDEGQMKSFPMTPKT